MDFGEVVDRTLNGERIQEDREEMRQCAVDTLRKCNELLDVGELSPDAAWVVTKGRALARYVIWLIDESVSAKSKLP